MSGSDNDSTDEEMSGEKKKSDGSKRETKKQSSRARAMSGSDNDSTDETPELTTITEEKTEKKTKATTRQITTIGRHPKPKIKSEKVEPITGSTPKKKEGPKNELESNQGAAGVDGQDKKAMPGSDSDHTDTTPRRTKTPTVKKETSDHSLKLENKGDKVKPSTQKGNAEGNGQDKEEMSGPDSNHTDELKVLATYENVNITVYGNHQKMEIKVVKDEPGSDSNPQKSGQVKKEPESYQEAVGRSDQVTKAKGTTPLPKAKGKMKSFVEESMQEKTIRHVPGIGKFSKLAENLEDDKYTMAEHILAHFLSKDIQRAKGLFKQFIKDYGGDEGCQNKAYNALVEWTKNHL